jgi:N-acetyl sugar amidotransferase
MKQTSWCTNCLNMSTRPRIQFDEKGWCNACQWSEKKKTLDWKTRESELVKLLDKHRRNDGTFDVVVPVSGGKDGSYVAHQLKHKYGMNPLTMTVTPALSLSLGDQNLKNFIASGFNHIQINPNPEIMRFLNKHGFIEMGFPYYGWLVSIQAAVISMTNQMNINLVFYGEDGEVEYGGSNETANRAGYDVSYMKKIYLEGGYEKVLNLVPEHLQKELPFWKFPNDAQLKKSELYITHFSYFENWDSYRNYVVAKEFCGLKENEETNVGTFTNFSQNDQALYTLHTYLMYLKFGFGRATQDAGIEVRRGAMKRDQAVNLVRLYDNAYPEHLIPIYLEYYQMTLEEFNAVLDRWANKDLFDKIDGRWMPNFELK